ncbi:hypothetical protein DBR32_04355 [Taibaiella sp. KBW10]|uniref:outer membrane beta-barrel protein n=1 Tax=Taibaiella sp. KBW10 TaxID=2153357 RepID=UPI000F5ABE2E|nr:outer membrane beta-barrel protein [Taibaiella sp. KBW10]RQO31207.1 hypothetical protein DBR32_04355 [Taibaiella sp. KBW10]
MRLFSTIIAVLLSLTLSAQTAYKISGIVKDNFNEEVLGAIIQLKTTENKYIKGTSSVEDGSFIIDGVENGKYILSITMIGAQPLEKNIDISDKDLNVGIQKFGNANTNLKEVTVTSTLLTGQQNQDTSSYNANAFKVNPDATAEDLVRKMPGIDLSGGDVKAQGEKVAKVLVDGKPFFGDDAASTLKNLPAEVISKIQVYDEKSEQSRLTGVDDGETVKAINIVTKTEKREGTFGKVFAGGGLDFNSISNGAVNNDAFRYSAGGNINYFKGDRRISFIAQSNNVNIQNFSSQDLLGISSSSGGRGFGRGGMGGGNSANNFMVNSQNGIAQTNALGFNYTDKLGKKVELTASYFFNNTNTNTTQETDRQYVLNNESGQTYKELSNATAHNYNHRVNARLTYTIDSNNTLIWVPSLSLQNNNSNSNLMGNTATLDNSIANSTKNDFESKLNGYSFSNMLMYFHKFKKAGRSFNIRINNGLNENKGNSSFYAINTFYPTVQLNDTLDQNSTLNRTGWNMNSNVEYTEPITKHSGIQISYNNGYQKTNSDKLTYNYDENTLGYTMQDTALSNKYTTIYKTNAVGLRYTFNNKMIRFNVGADAQKSVLEGERVFPYESAINKNFQNILPRAMMRVNFSKTKNLGLFYRTATNAPSVTQLQDVIDNSNPLQLTSGNPDLKQSYTHNLFSRYSSSNAKTNSMFFVMLRGSLTNDYIGNSTIIAANDTTVGNNITLAKGGQYTTQRNMDGYYSFNAFTTYSTPIPSLKSNINVNLNGGITRTPGYINNAKNYSNNRNVGLGVVFSSNISEKIDFTLSSNTNMNFVQNTLNSNADNNYLNQSTRLAANYIFWKGMVLNTELNHQLYEGLTSSANQNFLLWNAGIGKKLFKKQQAEIRLSVFDLLGQNRSIAQSFTESYNQTVSSNVLQRYFLLTFTYNIRNFRKGSTESDMETKGEGNMRMMPPPPPGGGMMPPPGGGPMN